MFDNERLSWSIMQTEDDPINEFLSDDEDEQAPESPTHLLKRESDKAMDMSSRHLKGMLKKTEGTICFYAPEMCGVEAKAFSGYAADLWAAGVCLHIFVTGKLPFFSLNPTKLFDMIVEDELNYNELNLSDEVKSLLRRLLTKDPSDRAGVGACLKHSFCENARSQRIGELDKEFEQSRGDIVLTDTDIDLALSVTLISDAFKPSSRTESRREYDQIQRRTINEESEEPMRPFSRLRNSFEREKDSSFGEREQHTKRPSLFKGLFKSGYFRRRKSLIPRSFGTSQD